MGEQRQQEPDRRRGILGVVAGFAEQSFHRAAIKEIARDRDLFGRAAQTGGGFVVTDISREWADVLVVEADLMRSGRQGSLS